uniref:Uncharacterized protein n=1 Tax=Xiphophorus maculatus TaxID=8083 RepID=A0A3B5QYM8_XIPMA
MPGTFPTRLTTILNLLLPVSTFTALLMVMLSRLTPFTSTSLSPTCRPASSTSKNGRLRHINNKTQQQRESGLKEGSTDHFSLQGKLAKQCVSLFI